MKRLAIIHTHPVQYNVPLYRILAKEKKIHIKIFYTWSQTKDGFYDPKFKRYIKWDIPLLDGYDFEFVKNISTNPSSKKFFGIINPELIKKIEKWKPDAIFITGWNLYSHLKTMIYFHNKIPVLFRGDSTLLDDKKNIKTTLRYWLLKKIYKNIDYALYVGKENKKYFKAAGLKEAQLIYAPHAIENERFFDKNGDYEQKAQKWKKELGIKKNDTVFIFVGKFEKKKNPILLLEAFKDLKDKNLKLIFIGNGELEAKMKNKSKKDRRIIFLPFQNQSKMPIIYRLGDVLILPSSYNETWGLAVNEAMASGLAIIVSNKVGCAPDLVFNEKNGYIFNYNDKDNLKEKMQNIIKADLDKFKQNSLTIIKKFNYKKIANAILQVLTE